LVKDLRSLSLAKQKETLKTRNRNARPFVFGARRKTGKGEKSKPPPHSTGSIPYSRSCPKEKGGSKGKRERAKSIEKKKKREKNIVCRRRGGEGKNIGVVTAHSRKKQF